jgi:hypothetical protein
MLLLLATLHFGSVGIWKRKSKVRQGNAIVREFNSGGSNAVISETDGVLTLLSLKPYRKADVVVNIGSQPAYPRKRLENLTEKDPLTLAKRIAATVGHKKPGNTSKFVSQGTTAHIFWGRSDELVTPKGELIKNFLGYMVIFETSAGLTAELYVRSSYNLELDDHPIADLMPNNI